MGRVACCDLITSLSKSSLPFSRMPLVAKTLTAKSSPPMGELLSSLDQSVECTFSDSGTKAPSSHIQLHANHILALFSMASQEFERTLCEPEAIVSVEYLTNGTELLIRIYEKYDQHEGDDTAMATFGEQLLCLFCEHLPNFVCISFKAMKDFYSHSMTGAVQYVSTSILFIVTPFTWVCCTCKKFCKLFSNGNIRVNAILSVVQAYIVTQLYKFMGFYLCTTLQRTSICHCRISEAFNCVAVYLQLYEMIFSVE